MLKSKLKSSKIYIGEKRLYLSYFGNHPRKAN